MGPTIKVNTPGSGRSKKSSTPENETPDIPGHPRKRPSTPRLRDQSLLLYFLLKHHTRCSASKFLHLRIHIQELAYKCRKQYEYKTVEFLVVVVQESRFEWFLDDKMFSINCPQTIMVVLSGAKLLSHPLQLIFSFETAKHCLPQ